MTQPIPSNNPSCSNKDNSKERSSNDHSKKNSQDIFQLPRPSPEIFYCKLTEGAISSAYRNFVGCFFWIKQKKCDEFDLLDDEIYPQDAIISNIFNKSMLLNPADHNGFFSAKYFEQTRNIPKLESIYESTQFIYKNTPILALGLLFFRIVDFSLGSIGFALALSLVTLSIITSPIACITKKIDPDNQYVQYIDIASSDFIVDLNEFVRKNINITHITSDFFPKLTSYFYKSPNPHNHRTTPSADESNDTEIGANSQNPSTSDNPNSNDTIDPYDLVQLVTPFFLID